MTQNTETNGPLRQRMDDDMRIIADLDPMVHWQHRVCKNNSRNVAENFPIPGIASLPNLVPQVINPVLRLFDGLEVSPEWIESLLPTFRKL